MAILSNIKAFWPLGDAITGTMQDVTGRGNSLVSLQRINIATGTFRMGANSAGTPSQQALASFKGWGTWNRILTSGEKAALAGGEYWPFTTTTSLQDAKAYYLLDESTASSSYADVTGRGNTLTATGTTIQVTGPGGGGDKGTQLTVNVYLSRTTPGTDLQSTQATRTVAGWINLTAKLNALSNQQVFWGQLVGAISGLNVYYDPTADRFCMDLDAGDSMNLTQGALVIDAVFGSPSIATWYFLIAEFDLSNNLIAISVNNGTRTTLGNRLQPLPVTGQVGLASQFQLNPTANFAGPTSGWDEDPFVSGVVAGNCALQLAPNADLSFGNTSKTVWGWFKTTSPSTYQTLGGFYNGTGAGTDWIVQIAGNALYFVLGLQQAYVSVAMSDTNWHLFVAWFDQPNNLLHLDLDHGAVVATPATGPATPQTVTNKFRLGSDTGNGGNDHQFLGLLNVWGIADGIPTQGDLDALWNSGTGWTLQNTPDLSTWDNLREPIRRSITRVVAY